MLIGSEKLGRLADEVSMYILEEVTKSSDPAYQTGAQFPVMRKRLYQAMRDDLDY